MTDEELLERWKKAVKDTEQEVKDFFDRRFTFIDDRSWEEFLSLYDLKLEKLNKARIRLADLRDRLSL